MTDPAPPDEPRGGTLHMTKAAIAELPLPPAGKRDWYRDADTTGLVLCVYPTGRMSWFYYRKVKGRPVQKKLGDYPDLSIPNARTLAARANAARGEGARDPVGRQRRGGMTWADLFKWWIEQVRVRKRSWAFDEKLNAWYLGPLQSRPLADITRADLRELHAELGRTAGKVQANRVMELVGAVFNRAIKHEVFDGPNPAEGIERFPQPSRDRRLMPDEAKRLFEAIAAEPSENLRDFVMLSLWTGARRGNVLAMRWDEIDHTSRTWRIVQVKTGRPQIIALGDEEMAILERRGAIRDKVLADPEATPEAKGRASDWVFPAPSASGHMTPPGNQWDRLRRRAGLPDLRMHDLRRTLGSWMVDTGASLPTIGHALGHTSPAATAVYARMLTDTVRAPKARAVKAIKAAAGIEDERPATPRRKRAAAVRKVRG